MTGPIFIYLFKNVKPILVDIFHFSGFIWFAECTGCPSPSFVVYIAASCPPSYSSQVPATDRMGDRAQTLRTSEADDEEIKDFWCDPENPRTLKFEDVSAAAYMIRDGVIMTPG